MLNSKIFLGRVRHRRYIPHEHEFSYNMFMMYLDLDELDTLFDLHLLWSAHRFNLAWFNRKHHLGDSSIPLKKSVIDLVYEKKGIKLTGPIRVLTHLSYFGYGFNPASFYYCYNKEGTSVDVIVVEVNNTPWGEQFCYVLPVIKDQEKVGIHKFELEKEFHVSPFNPMDHHYAWNFNEPGSQLSVYMANFKGTEKVFDATLGLTSKEITSRNLSRVLFQFPLMTVKVIGAIYYQAFKLLLKRTPLYTHPEKITSPLRKGK